MTHLKVCLTISDVGLDPKYPVDVNDILVQLEQEGDEDKDGIHHDEGEDHHVSQVL